MPDIDAITGYHAHVYFDAASEAEALALRERIETELDVEVGRIHRKPVGPHPHWSYQLAFPPEQLGTVVPYLMLNRGRLDILVHPRTGNEIRDHFDYAAWLGEKADLDRKPLLPKE